MVLTHTVSLSPRPLLLLTSLFHHSPTVINITAVHYPLRSGTRLFLDLGVHFFYISTQHEKTLHNCDAIFQDSGSFFFKKACKLMSNKIPATENCSNAEVLLEHEKSGFASNAKNLEQHQKRIFIILSRICARPRKGPYSRVPQKNI